jgi:hypothetical protein
VPAEFQPGAKASNARGLRALELDYAECNVKPYVGLS